MWRKNVARSDNKFKNDQGDGFDVKLRKKSILKPSKCYEDGRYESKNYETHTTNDNLKRRKIIRCLDENNKPFGNDSYIMLNTSQNKQLLTHKTINRTDLTSAKLCLADTPQVISNCTQPRGKCAFLLPCNNDSKNHGCVKKKLCILTPNHQSNMNEHKHMCASPRKENNSQGYNSCILKSRKRCEYQKENNSKGCKRTDVPNPCSKLVVRQKCNANPKHCRLLKFLKLRSASQPCKVEEPANCRHIAKGKTTSCCLKRAACDDCNQDNVCPRDRKKCKKSCLKDTAEVTKPKKSIFRRLFKSKYLPCDPFLPCGIDADTHAELTAIQANHPMLPKSVNYPLLKLVVDNTTKKIINRDEILQQLGTRRHETGVVKQGRLVVKKKLVPPPELKIIFNKSEAKIVGACHINENLKRCGRYVCKGRTKVIENAPQTPPLQIRKPTVQPCTITRKRPPPKLAKKKPVKKQPAATEEILESISNTPTARKQPMNVKENPECQKVTVLKENVKVNKTDCEKKVEADAEAEAEAKRKGETEEERRKRVAELSQKAFAFWDALDTECSLYVGSLRKKPCLWIHYLWPRCYPHCINLIGIWKKFTNVCMFMMATAVWTPCLICMALCRGFVCSFIL